MFRIAVGQFEPDADPARNALQLRDFAVQAADRGARLLVLPEGSLVRFVDDPGAAGRAAQALDGPFAQAALDASRTFGLAIAVGSFTPHEDRVHNTLIVVDRGELLAAYDKLHLYDAFSFVESNTVAPGKSAPPVIRIDGIAVGFATCYDLRFPELFRLLSSRGAQVIAVSAAWVAGPLKEEHWLTLLKARAIENTSYVVGADQSGRKVVGRSAAFDPMGLPLFDLGSASTLGIVDVDPDRLAEVRAVLPALNHRRLAVSPVPE